MSQIRSSIPNKKVKNFKDVLLNVIDTRTKNSQLVALPNYSRNNLREKDMQFSSEHVLHGWQNKMW